MVGLTTEDTAKLGNPEYLHNVKFEDPTTVAKATLKELNEKLKPDVKIAFKRIWAITMMRNMVQMRRVM